MLSGYEFAYVGRVNDEPYVEVLNPLGVFYHKSPETMYIQDGLYAGYKTYMTSADILDRFGQFLSEDDKDKIDRKDKISGDALIGNSMKYPDNPVYDSISSYTGSYGNTSYKEEDFIVSHIE